MSLKKSDFIKRYGEEAWEKKLEYQRNYNLEHKDEISIRKAEKYKENREYVLNKRKSYYNENKEEILNKSSEYRKNHREQYNLYNKNYRNSKKGRANKMYYSNNCADSKRGFDISQNVKEEWIIDNIFSGQVCTYCGETDWHKLGCDRIDNTKPHTADNIVPCCRHCNSSRQNLRTVEEQREYTRTKN